jgi:hypothetical protein
VTKRFCFLTTFYPPFNFGGDGLAVQRMARALAKRGHDVTVVHDADAFAILSDEPLPEDETPDPFGVNVITLRTALPWSARCSPISSGVPSSTAASCGAFSAKGSSTSSISTTCR